MAKVNYELMGNEAIILKQDRILYGGVMANFNSELILTNLNLILINKGVFGNIKNLQKFPVNQIKVFNNQAQVLLSKTSGGYPQIEVYFIDGCEKFGFESKRTAINWVNTINNLTIGADVKANNAAKITIPGTEMIAEAIGGTVKTFKDALGFKSAEQRIEKVAKRCDSCGASISGNKGQLVRCTYCDTDQQL